jgi:AAA15 family ATPase/GTPase
MIKYFAVENYKSIKNKAILEFDSNLAEDYPYPASAVIGFAGANASGKTTILQAISFVFWFMQESFSEIKEDQAIPVRPFATMLDSPSKFHLIFTQKSSENNYIDYEYLLTVNQEEVLEEEVYYYPNNDQELVYKREEQQVEFGKDIHILNRDVTSALRPKNSIISFLAQFPSQDKAKTFQKYLFVTNINAQGGFKDLQFDLSVARNLMNKSNNKFDLLDILKIADIGIEDINIEEIDILSIIDNLEDTAAWFNPEEVKPIRVMFKKGDPLGIKRLVDSISNQKEQIKFKHKMDNSFVELLDSNQSAGTLKLLALLERIQLAFHQGSLLIIDEIELRLHQNLIAYLIGLFENANQNIEGGQLLFSFHNTALMEILQPNQLWFTEKNDQGQTEIFSAADFTDIKDIQQRNLEELYRIGRFGAKPRAL